MDELVFSLRAEGEPHTWPEAWTFVSETPADDSSERARRWLDSVHSSGVRRCGVGRAKTDGGNGVGAIIVVDALADLEPLPTHARLGQWIVVNATLLVPCDGAKLVVLPPRGPPRTLLLTTLHETAVEATFSVDRQGPWIVQLVGNVAGGPRPLLEADVFVDEDAPSTPGERPAPGENAARSGSSDAVSLGAMVNAARRTEGIAKLDLSAELANAAEEHALAMQRAQKLAHDVGDGSPTERLRRAGLEPSRPGENVAHAQSIERAHRVLWASPSHRGNMLDDRFSKLGVGVARDTDGSVWVCELFTDSGNAGMIRRTSETY